MIDLGWVFFLNYLKNEKKKIFYFFFSKYWNKNGLIPNILINESKDSFLVYTILIGFLLGHCSTKWKPIKIFNFKFWVVLYGVVILCKYLSIFLIFLKNVKCIFIFIFTIFYFLFFIFKNTFFIFFERQNVFFYFFLKTKRNFLFFF